MSSDLRKTVKNTSEPSRDSIQGSDARSAESVRAISPACDAASDAKHAGNPPAGDPHSATEPASTPGELLRAARESAGLSVGDIATRLRMAARQIDALEKSDYANLPSGTFLRGFVRSYAKSVQMDPVLAITLLEKTHSIATVAKPAPIVVPSHGIKIDIGTNELASTKIRIAILVGVLVLLGSAVWYWWEYMRPGLADGGRAKPAAEVIAARAESTPPPETPTSQPATSAAVAPDAAAKEDSAVPNPSIGAPSEPVSAAAVGTANTSPPKLMLPAQMATTAPATVPTLSPVSAPEASKVKDAKATIAGKGGSILGFTFSGESWVEVVDGTGKTILSRRYKAGEADEVTGRAPFSIVIGKAGATRMAYNGKEFDLTPHTKLSVARVTVK